MEKRGYLEASEMAGTFNLLRANDLVWRYVASSWLQGDDPPSFDILQWNEDATRMPARMHSEYLRWMYLENRLATGTLEIGGKKVSLAKSPTELYVLSAREDHITPWRGCYLTTQLAGGPKRFVLTSSGHIAGIALLVGSIVPLDLRLLGAWRSVPLAPLWRVLTRTAAVGLALAVTFGVLLFITRASEYVASGFFLAKMALVAAATVNALLLRAGAHDDLLRALPSGQPSRRMRIAGALSLAAWLAALTLGRLVGYF